MVQHYSIFDFQSFPPILGKDIYFNKSYFVYFHTMYTLPSDYSDGEPIVHDTWTDDRMWRAAAYNLNVSQFE
jgi:hypothetical protein